jgi:hypothetical protein
LSASVIPRPGRFEGTRELPIISARGWINSARQGTSP